MVLQVNEIHECSRGNVGSALVVCSKCGQRYKADQIHVCPTMIKWFSIKNENRFKETKENKLLQKRVNLIDFDSLQL